MKVAHVDVVCEDNFFKISKQFCCSPDSHPPRKCSTGAASPPAVCRVDLQCCYLRLIAVIEDTRFHTHTATHQLSCFVRTANLAGTHSHVKSRMLFFASYRSMHAYMYAYTTALL
jgi:hypothetical protein